MNHIKIDKEVYANGHSLGLFVSISHQQAEHYCRDKSRITGFKYDFFYEDNKINIMTLNPNHH